MLPMMINKLYSTDIFQMIGKAAYDLIGAADDEIVSFRKEQEVAAGRGEAGSLIPPFDYHIIANPHEEAAVTIHVYGGEMEGCDVFQPVEGDRYQRIRKPLSYTA